MRGHIYSPPVTWMSVGVKTKSFSWANISEMLNCCDIVSERRHCFVVEVPQMVVLAICPNLGDPTTLSCIPAHPSISTALVLAKNPTIGIILRGSAQSQILFDCPTHCH